MTHLSPVMIRWSFQGGYVSAAQSPVPGEQERYYLYLRFAFLTVSGRVTASAVQ